MTPTDTQLKQALAKMLPEKLYYEGNVLGWKRYPDDNSTGLHYAKAVLDTELLHLCWLAEHTIDSADKAKWLNALSAACYKEGDSTAMIDLTFNLARASWQQRTIALAKVKGVEIV